MNLQRYKTQWQQPWDTEDDIYPTRRLYRKLQPRQSHVVSLGEPLSIAGNRRSLRSLLMYSSLGVPMSTNDLIAAVELGKFDIDDTAAMNFVLYWRVYVNDNPWSSKCTESTNLEASIWTQNRHFKNWRQRQNGYSDSLSDEAVGAVVNSARRLASLRHRNTDSDEQITNRASHMEGKIQYMKPSIAGISLRNLV